MNLHFYWKTQLEHTFHSNITTKLKAYSSWHCNHFARYNWSGLTLHTYLFISTTIIPYSIWFELQMEKKKSNFFTISTTFSWHNRYDMLSRNSRSFTISDTLINECSHHFHAAFSLTSKGQLTLKVLNFSKFTSYCSLKPLWSGMGEVVPARISPTLHPPSPPTVHQLSRLAL